MSSRKLRVVGFEKTYIDFDDDMEYKNFFEEVDTRCFHSKSSDWWKALKAEEDEAKWTTDLFQFLSDIGVKENMSKPRRVIVNALLDFLINKKYEGNELAHQLTGARFLEKEEERTIQSQNKQNPLNLIDYSSEEFATKARNLCQLLGIIEHPDPVVCLKAACIFISENLNENVIKERNAEHKSGKTPSTFELRSFPLDVPDQKDGAVNAVARILRLLNIEVLRETQTNVNETLVAIQNLTIDETKKPAVKQVKYGF